MSSKTLTVSSGDPTYYALAVALRHLLLRYTQALIAQMAQTAVCNRYYSLDQQLC